MGQIVDLLRIFNTDLSMLQIAPHFSEFGADTLSSGPTGVKTAVSFLKPSCSSSANKRVRETSEHVQSCISERGALSSRWSWANGVTQTVRVRVRRDEKGKGYVCSSCFISSLQTHTALTCVSHTTHRKQHHHHHHYHTRPWPCWRLSATATPSFLLVATRLAPAAARPESINQISCAASKTHAL